MTLNNFDLSASYSRKIQRRGGTCILSKKMFHSVELKEVRNFSVEKHFEVCGIEIKKLHLIVLCLYRTPNSNISIFFDKLDKLLTKLEYKKCKIVLAFDFNINFFRTDNTTTKFNELVSNYGMQCHIHVPTRLNTCIDNIISNVPNVTGKTHNLFLSDHNTAQIIEFRYLKSNITTQYFVFRTDFVKKMSPNLLSLSVNCHFLKFMMLQKPMRLLKSYIVY